MSEPSSEGYIDPRLMAGQPGQTAFPSVNGPPGETESAAAPAGKTAGIKHDEHKDAFREVVETVVFVVVLVLLLRSFMAEAFVIPTGSMATTLLGYHRVIECPECGFRFPLNLSKELDGPQQNRRQVTGCECPNCRLPIDGRNSNQFPPQQP